MAVREAVIARSEKAYELFNRGDIDEMAKIYAENVIVYDHGKAPILGRQAIKEALTKVNSSVKKLELEQWQYFEQFNDNTAYTLAFTKAFDSSGKLVGRYKGCLLWRKIDGTWFIDHDIFNELPQ